MFSITTKDPIQLTRGAISTLSMDLSIHCPEGDDPSTADFYGTIRADDREINDLEEMDLIQLIIDNRDVLYHVLELMSD